jgi:hypothetical protein
MTGAELRFPYEKRPQKIIFACLFFAACCIGLLYEASSNHRELILNGIFHFSVAGANALYWCLGVISGVFVGVGLLGLFTATKKGQVLVLTDSQLTVPPVGLNRKSKTVNLAQVQRVTMTAAAGQRFMSVYYSGGKVTVSHDPVAFFETESLS